MLFPTLTMAASANNEYVSDWWHQSINIVGSNSTRFGPLKRADLYPEYRAWAHVDWFDFYGYADLPKFFGIGNDNDIGIWDNGSPFFMEIEPRFSIDKLTGVDLSFGPFKEWYFAHNYIYDAGTNAGQRQSTWYMGIGTDIETGLPMTLSANIVTEWCSTQKMHHLSLALTFSYPIHAIFMPKQKKHRHCCLFHRLNYTK